MAAGRRTAASTTKNADELRRESGQSEHEEITLKLAHPLREGNPFTGEPGEPGEEVTVKRYQARNLIASGYAAVDPEDAGAVEAALQLGPGDGGEGEPKNDE